MAAELRKIGVVEVARPPAGEPCVERHDNSFEARSLGPADEAFGKLNILWRVELEKARRVFEFLCDGLQRIVRQSRGDHGNACSSARRRRREVAVTVLGANAEDADRRHEQRGGQLQAKQIDGKIALRRIDHHPRHEPPAPEGRSVEILRMLVAAATLNIGEYALWEHGLRLFLQRTEVDGEFRLTRE